MKKIIVLLTVMVASITATFAQQPQYFAFEIGTGAAYDSDSGDIVSATGMGFSYSFSDVFKGGFSFSEIDGNSLDTVSISIVPVEKVTLTMYTGQLTDGAAASTVAFGVGLGFDFFTNSKTLFTALGFYLDWYAADNASTVYSINDGGIISMGIKTKIGI